MIPVGYLYKKVALRPDWLQAEAVFDVYSLSICVSDDFAYYTDYWKHNGYWLFNSPEEIKELASNEGIDLQGTTLFYYEVYEYEFDEDLKEWFPFTPDPVDTNVQVPTHKQLEGFDVATFRCHNIPEHSPLSCNSLATTIPVNKHCLINTFAEAKAALDDGLFIGSEPGPYRIFAVYTVV